MPVPVKGVIVFADCSQANASISSQVCLSLMKVSTISSTVGFDDYQFAGGCRIIADQVRCAFCVWSRIAKDLVIRGNW